MTTAAGVALWAVQKAWSWMSNERAGLALDTSVLVSWGMLLVNPPSALPTSLPTRVREAEKENRGDLERENRVIGNM